MLQAWRRFASPIAVVGANSPLGRRVVAMLLVRGHRVRCVIRMPNRIASSWLSHPRCEVDTTIGAAHHVVWLAHVHHPDRREQIRANARLLEGALVERRHVVFVSSGGAVYGEPDALPVWEGHPRRPISPYGVAKCVLEDLVAVAAEREGAGVILRPGNIYGPEYFAAGCGAVAAFARGLLSEQPISLRDAGRGARDFVHVDDVARAVVTAVAWRRGLAVWNVGTGVATPTRDVLDELCALLRRRPAQIVEQPRAETDVSAICLSTRRIEADCGWRAAHPLAAGLASTVNELLVRPPHEHLTIDRKAS